MNTKQVVIVGGGFGGINCAKMLTDSSFQVTIIDKTNHHLFQPLLYQVATAALSPGDIASPIRAIFSKRKNIRVIMGEVTEIQKERHAVILKDGRELAYEYLILAPGSQYNYFGHDNWSDMAPGLKSLSDALDIRERILVSLEHAEQLASEKEQEPYLTFAIIGGGPTGVEMAGAIAEIVKRNMLRDFQNIHPEKTQIYLIEAADNILSAFSKKLSGKAKSTLEKMGVQILLNNPVTEITGEGVGLNDQFIRTPNVIWAAGVTASPLLKSLGLPLEKGGKIAVEKDLSIPGYPDIFVIGDSAAYKEDHIYLPALAPVAIQQGRFVGRLINKDRSSNKAFGYVDKGTMATIGRARAVAEIKNLKISGLLAWLTWSFIHIFFLIGFRNRFRVMAEWIWYYISFRRGVRLITDRKMLSDKLNEGKEWPVGKTEFVG